MPKKPGRGPRKNRRGPGGPPGDAARGGEGGGRGRPGRGGKRAGSGGPGGRGGRQSVRKSDYFMQPGRRGVFVVLRRPIGNRVEPKVCGTMPSSVHAKMLIQQLERAESVVKDLFMEATDDGIEALEAVLAACREEVMKRGPAVTEQPEAGGEMPPLEGGDEAALPDRGDADVESPYEES
jgi:hypothetical protein